MDPSIQLRHLEEVERHITQGIRHIAEQKRRIANFVRLGYDTTEARKLLENFYATQAQHVQHRERIRAELEQ
jgi:hypothetical protein